MLRYLNRYERLLKIGSTVTTLIGFTTSACSPSVPVNSTATATKNQSVSSTSSPTSCTDNALNSAQCLTADVNRYVTSTLGTNFSASATNSTQSTSIAVSIPTTGFYTSGIVATATDSSLIASNIVSGATIFGVNGSIPYCSSNAQSRCVTNSSYLAGAPASSNTNGTNGSLSITPPAGYYDGTSKTVTASDSNLSATNIVSGVSIFGTTGSVTAASLIASNANRDSASVPAYISGVVGSLGGTYSAGSATSSQITLNAEVSTYGQGGASDGLLPSSGGYNYRDIPDLAKDDDGYLGTSIAWALRPQTACGSSGTIATRVANCASLNGSRATWSGANSGNRGHGAWNLVYTTGTNSGACTTTYCKEVWQDARTGLIWSSAANGGAIDNWCKASGNIQYAPVTLNQGYHSAAGTHITGTGTISNITGGSSSLNETITIAFTSSTAFTVTSTSTGCNTAHGGAISSGGLSASSGSTVTYGRNNYCRFTLTQGSTAFVSGDTFTLASTPAVTYSCYPNAASGLQPTNYVSYCAEQTGYYPGFTSGTWGTGDSYTSGWTGASYTYDQAKGGMGRTSTYPVYWRLPTLDDYYQASIDGIRFVMPDMGNASSARAVPDNSPGHYGWEWTASILSDSRINAWNFTTDYGQSGNAALNSAYTSIRCVGR